jgi:hypothetical protein
MKKGKLAIAFIVLAVFYVSVVWAEYNLVMRSGIIFSVTSIFALLLVLHALHRAPEGYEDENGFHIGALADAVPL